MSVIPLIRNETVVDSMDAFDAAKGRVGTLILILNLDPEQLRCDDKSESNVTYDLRVGEDYRDHRDPDKRKTTDAGEIVIGPSGAVIIETLEYVHLPGKRFAYIVPKVSQLQRGLSNTASKVDPGYAGNLLITVFNLGKTTVTLKKGDRFCTIVFHDVAEGVRLYNKVPKKITGIGTTRWFHRIRDFLDRNSTTLVVILILSQIVMTVLTIFLLFFHPSGK